MADSNLVEVGAVITGSVSTNDTGFLASTGATIGALGGLIGVAGIVGIVGRAVAGIVVMVVAGAIVKFVATIVLAFVVAIGGSFSGLFSGGLISFGASNFLREHGTERTCSIGPR